MAWKVNPDGTRTWVSTPQEKANQALTSKILGSNTTQPAGTYTNNPDMYVSNKPLKAVTTGYTNTQDQNKSGQSSYTGGLFDNAVSTIDAGFDTVKKWFSKPETPAPFNYGQAYADKGFGTLDKWNSMTGAEQAAFAPLLDKDNQSGILSGIGGAQGLASILGGISQLGSLWTGMERNKLAKKEVNMRNDEINRQKQRDVDFANAINKSGLGSYSAGTK